MHVMLVVSALLLGTVQCGSDCFMLFHTAGGFNRRPVSFVGAAVFECGLGGTVSPTMQGKCHEGGSRGRQSGDDTMDGLVKLLQQCELDSARRRQEQLEDEVRELKRKLGGGGGGGCQQGVLYYPSAFNADVPHLPLQPVLFSVFPWLVHPAVFGWQVPIQDTTRGVGGGVGASSSEGLHCQRSRFCSKWNQGSGQCTLPDGSCLYKHPHRCYFLTHDAQRCAVDGCAMWRHHPSEVRKWQGQGRDVSVEVPNYAKKDEGVNAHFFCRTWNQGKDTRCMLDDGTCSLGRKHGCSFRHPDTQHLCGSEGCARWRHFGRVVVAGGRAYCGNTWEDRGAANYVHAADDARDEEEGNGKYNLLARWQRFGKDEMCLVRKHGWQSLPVVQQQRGRKQRGADHSSDGGQEQNGWQREAGQQQWKPTLRPLGYISPE